MLDVAVLATLERDLGDPGLVREVVQVYLDQLDVRRQALLAAVAVGDSRAVRREAHTLGSASAMVGAVELLARCRDLERSELPEGPLTGHPLVVAWARASEETETAVAGWLARA